MNVWIFGAFFQLHNIWQNAFPFKVTQDMS